MSFHELFSDSEASQGRSYAIANTLRDAIYRGLIQENEQLHQSQLADQLGVSPIPLREALKQLESEGLVRFQGRRGAVVTGLSLAEAREIYDMITWIECGVFRLAFPLLTKRLLDDEERLLQTMEAEPDVVVWRDLNAQFHASLYEPADRPMTMDTLATLRRQVDRYIRVHLDSMRDESEKQHRRILQAAIKGDVEEAVAALAEHLENTSKDLQAHMRTRRRSRR